ncbi:BZ3500_MvSof-1268-A1-R1_Chr2-1g04230 [Microbotryum saponariae]|uniref:BZ3500_MvSof-1268-A1-R1_Chr2-1g04230 protein n=1 Tax=Microbotryum saponariae TaxID=289078 RepID=A0A2X0KPW6_9BASI|nr:BZ3500_MvSof-1268-A1-R1_Chr2-1g04230 [Microbotryum saponariae]SCZ91217.1 BZ3501_MvSof-1269-A2-R1_Chr2-1g03886 [Microbotryum saponariae]
MVVSLASAGGAARVYCINGSGNNSKNAAAWLEAKIGKQNAGKRRKQGGQGGTGGEGEIRLIQDFEFPEASNKIKTTSDGQYVVATGTYKPRMKVFDLQELSLKTERVTDSENVDFCILSSDWTKTLHLQADRSLDLHTQASSHYRVRMPKHGRAVAYHFPSCDALVGGQGNQVWRLNLEVGRFMKPYGLEGCTSELDGGEGGVSGDGLDTVLGVNAIDINPAHQLLSFGTETELGRGTVEMWDPRSRARAGILRLPYAKLMAASGSSAALLQPALPGVDDPTTDGRRGVAVTALSSKSDGLNLAVGTSTGHILLYDLRAQREYTMKDQGYGLPIKKAQWVDEGVGRGNAEGGYVASVDEKVVKIWGRETGTNLISINPPVPINDMHVYSSSGLVFLANETSPMTGYYIPQLGPAPKWCRFLDNMTEEMEQDQEALLYDDYKFVDRQELDALNLSHLIGSNQLKPYMHGYFLDLRLYTKAKAIANPFAYAEHRDRLVRERLEQEQESRIRGAKKVSGANGGAGALPSSVKVNKALAKKAQEAERKREPIAEGEDVEMEDGERKKKKKKAQVETPSLLKDDRFGDLFVNPDFEIDEQSREFALLNPSTKPTVRGQEDDEDEDSDDDDEEEEDDEDKSEDGDSDSSDEGDLGFDAPRRGAKALPTSRVSTKDIQPVPRGMPETQSKPSLVVADESDDETPSKSTRSGPQTLSSHQAKQSRTFGQRAREELFSKATGKGREADTTRDDSFEVIRSAPGGGMEMSFIPHAKTKEEQLIEKKEKKHKIEKERKAKASFGVGMETSSGPERIQKELEGEQESGRTRMRKPMRSASKGKIRSVEGRS